LHSGRAIKYVAEYDENLIAEEMLTLVLQVNGKVRDRLEMTAWRSCPYCQITATYFLDFFI